MADGFILDNANIIDDKIEIQLEQEFYTIQQNQNIEIGIFTTNNPEQYPIELLANEVFNNWKIGDKNANSGILYVIDPDNRQSRIEIGYGIETIISDYETLKIQELTYPYFRESQYTKGTLILIENLLQLIEGKSFDKQIPESNWLGLNLIFLGILSFVYVYTLGMFRNISNKTTIIIFELIAIILAIILFENIFQALPSLYLNIWLINWFKKQHRNGKIQYFTDINLSPGGFGGAKASGHSSSSFGGGSSGGGGVEAAYPAVVEVDD